MIKSLNNIHIDKDKTLLHLSAIETIKKLEVDRSESSFGAHASLTQKEIEENLYLAHQARKRTAW